MISAFVGAYFRSFGLALVSFFAGIAIDADHFLDYYLNHDFTVNLKKIYETCRDTRLRKLYLIFHSFEAVILLWLAIYLFKLSNLWAAIAIGFTQHMILDQVTNPLAAPGYFLAWRICKGFDKESVMRPGAGKRELKWRF